MAVAVICQLGSSWKTVRKSGFTLLKDAPRFTRRIYLAWHQTDPSSDALASDILAGLSRQFLDKIASQQDVISAQFVDI
jgi:hypothetical protein